MHKAELSERDNRCRLVEPQWLTMILLLRYSLICFSIYTSVPSHADDNPLSENEISFINTTYQVLNKTGQPPQIYVDLSDREELKSPQNKLILVNLIHDSKIEKSHINESLVPNDALLENCPTDQVTLSKKQASLLIKLPHNNGLNHPEVNTLSNGYFVIPILSAAVFSGLNELSESTIGINAQFFHHVFVGAGGTATYLTRNSTIVERNEAGFPAEGERDKILPLVSQGYAAAEVITGIAQHRAENIIHGLNMFGIISYSLASNQPSMATDFLSIETTVALLCIKRKYPNSLPLHMLYAGAFFVYRVIMVPHDSFLVLKSMWYDNPPDEYTWELLGKTTTLIIINGMDLYWLWGLGHSTYRKVKPLFN